MQTDLEFSAKMDETEVQHTVENAEQKYLEQEGDAR